MRVTLDGNDLFGHDAAIEVAAAVRAAVHKSVPGLDGVLSEDLGGRSRQITQAGTLRAGSVSSLQEKIDQIRALLDGKTHTLASSDGRQYGDVRVDAVKAGEHRASGGGVVADYEIIYTQLKV